MTRTLRPALQVIDYVRRLAPEPRRAIKLALKGMSQERGDIRALEGTLVGYHRLRVGRHRIIFNHAKDGAVEAIEAAMDDDFGDDGAIFIGLFHWFWFLWWVSLRYLVLTRRVK